MPPEILIIARSHQTALASFFQDLVRSGDEKYFHPHPLTCAEARARACYQGRDLYYGVLDKNIVVGYGLLRGWDEGYEIPSLGLAIHASARGKGLGQTLMHFLHAAARLRGCTQVRLTVSQDNIPALTLYKDLGYSLKDLKPGHLVGTINL